MLHTNASPTSVSAPAPAQAKSLRRLDDVRELVRADSLGLWDSFASREELAFKDGHLAFLNPQGDEMRLAPTSWATGQLCARLGIPASYFRKCPGVLQDVQANYWLRQSQPQGDDAGARWMLRAKGDRLRAVLSDRYSPLDNAELLDLLLPMLEPHHLVDWLSLEEEGLHLRVVDPKRTRDVLPGDGLSVGIHIANSEVGFRSLRVDALVYRLVCTNGLIRLVQGKSLLRQRHVHIARPRFVACLEEAVSLAWAEAEGFLEQIEATTRMRVSDVPGTLERLGEKWHLSQNVQDDLLLSLRREPSRVQETVYGLVNAVTSVAQRMAPETRYDLEVLAGHLAEHGVAAYASRKKRASLDEIEEPFDAVEAAREMFEAQVVSRRPLPARAKEMVEA